MGGLQAFHASSYYVVHVSSALFSAIIAYAVCFVQFFMHQACL
jgi:hypothetical protein